MEEDWKCTSCSTLNKQENERCELCDTPKPKQTKSVPSNKPPLIQSIPTNRKPAQLFRTKKDNLIVSRTTLAKLRRRFGTNKMVVIVVAGMVGTGKSTWLNAVLKDFEIKESSCATFEVGQKTTTQTEGIWVYPYPLKSPLYPKTQFMLMDMEGMGGIKKEKDDIVSRALNKLYTVGMLLSSTFVIHTHFRPDISTVNSLKMAFMVVKQQRDKFGVEIPKIYLLCRDSETISVKGDQGSFLSILQSHCDLDESLMSQLQVMGRPKPPDEWLKSNGHSYSCLQGTLYLKFTQQLIKEVAPLIKKQPPLLQPINIEEFCELVSKVGVLVNDKDFSKFFQGNLDQMVFAILSPVKKKYMTLFDSQSVELANQFDVSNHEKFPPALEELRSKLIKQYDVEVSKTISLSRDSQVLTNFRAQVVISMKGQVAETQFLYKVKLHENNQQMQQKIDALIKENEKKEQHRKKAINTLKTNQKTLEKQLEDNKAESARVIAKMEAESEEQKNHIAKCRELIENLTAETKQLTAEKVSITNQSVQELVLDTLSKMWSTSNSDGLKSNLDKEVTVMMANLEKQKETIINSAEQKKKQISNSEYQTGLDYYNKKDMVNAFQHLKAAADANHDQASFLLGEIFLSPPNELRFPRNEQKALEYFKQCSPDNKNAQNRVRELSTKFPPIIPEEQSPEYRRVSDSQIIVPDRLLQEQQKINSKSNVTRDLDDIATSDFFSAIDTLKKYSLVKDIHSFAEYAYRRVEDIFKRGDDNMTIDEMAAICLYTMEWPVRQESLYFVVNQYLRENERNTQHFYPLIKLIVSGLRKKTPFKGTAWRSFNGVANISSLYSKGKVLYWSAFTSCSSDVSVCGVNFFAGGGSNGENTLFNIQVTNGYEIDKYSTFPNENEKLLLPGSKVKVIDVLKASDSLSIVQLQQLE